MTYFFYDSISPIQRISSCELEYDVHINDICNEPPRIGKLHYTSLPCDPFLFIDNGIANPGLQALWNGERIRRANLNITNRLTPPTSPGALLQIKLFIEYLVNSYIERPRTNPFAAEIRHQEKLKANIEKR